jgi:MarR family transcriptional regulator, organic hydroperoxide resistance regulator
MTIFVLMEDQRKIEAQISTLFYTICKQRRITFGKYLADLGLYAGQDLLLKYLSQNESGYMNVSDLVEKMAVSAPTVSRMISRMETTGLINKYADDSDKRITRIALTDSGKAMIEKIDAVWGKVRGLMVSDFTENEKYTLQRLLQKILGNII